MNRRALVISLLFAVLAIATLFLYRRRFEEEASGGYMVKILVIAKPMVAGEPIDEEAIATRTVPRGYVEDRAITESDKGKVLGLRVIRSLHPPEALLWSDLPAAADDRRNLSGLVQPGMRALTVRVEGRVPAVKPGDRVDLIATMNRPDRPEVRTSIVLLQNVLVLGFGKNLRAEVDLENPDPNQGLSAKERAMLSLSVNVQDSQLLSLAKDRASLLVALRSPFDQRVSEGLRDVPDTAVADAKLRAAVQNVRRTGALGQLDTAPTGSAAPATSPAAAKAAAIAALSGRPPPPAPRPRR